MGLGRFKAVVKKELREIKRDKGFLLVLLLQPILIMSIFSYAFQGEISHLPTAIIDYDGSTHANKITDALTSSEYFDISITGNSAADFEEANTLLEKSDIRAIIVIPEGFGEDIDNSKNAQLETYIDSSDYLVYNTLKAASTEVLKESFESITTTVVKKIEKEKEAEEAEVEEAKSKVDKLYSEILRSKSKINSEGAKVEGVKDDVEVMLEQAEDVEEALEDIDDNRESVSSVQSKVETMESDLQDYIDTLSDSVDTYPEYGPIISQLTEFQSDINDIEDDIDNLAYEDVNVNSLIDDVTEIREKIEDVQDDVNTIAVSPEDYYLTDIENQYKDIENQIEGVNLDFTGLSSGFLSKPADLKTDYRYGNISYFDYLTPAVISMILFFVYIFVTTVNLVEEKTKGTLYRTSLTPLKKSEFLVGKFFAFAAVGVVESLYILLLAVYVFNTQAVGSLFYVFIIEMLLVAPTLGLGLLLSAVIKTERQAIGILPLITIPAILVSQTFSPIEVIPSAFRWLAYLSPMTYSNEALRAIMIKGYGITEVLDQIYALVALGVISLTAGIIAFKKRIE